MAEFGLIIPGLTRAAAEGSGVPRRLRAWLARSRPLPRVSGGIDAVLQACAQGTPQADDRLPVAPLMALGDRVQRLEGAQWRGCEVALAEPVSLAVHTDHVTVAGPPAPVLTAEEAGALAAALGTLWAADGLAVEVAAPDRWYLFGAGAAAMAAGISPVSECLDVRFDQALLSSQDSRRLRRLLTEAQMLFHAHPVNAQREGAGQGRVDGLWLSGGGHCPPPTPCRAQLLATAPQARGLMRLAGRPPLPPPADFAALSAAWPAGESDCWVALSGQADDRFADLERAWLRPAWQALARGRLAGLSWRDETGRGGRLSRADRLRLWARWRP